MTDAAGRQTTLTYGFTPRPLQISQITDPFGRSATLTYDGSGNLASITDVIGLTSTLGYDANQLVNSLTTPYGTTAFAYTAPGTAAPPRFVQATDPMGFNEREEWLEPAPVSATDPAATVPTGMPGGVTNNYLPVPQQLSLGQERLCRCGLHADRRLRLHKSAKPALHALVRQ